jgi:hypothetical protein
MQTRFSDLSYLLYDFLGVILLIGTIVAIFILGLRSYTWWKGVWEPLKRNTVHRRDDVGRYEGIVIRFMFILIWAVTIPSFLVGMIKDVQLGLMIFGFGGVTAATIGAFIMLFGELYISVLSPWAAAIYLLMFNWNS